MADEAVFKKVLKNGLVVLVKPRPHQDLAAIHVKIRAGSSHEAEYLGSGITHLVEHMVFKGTATRTAQDIERELKSRGGTINGSVSHDSTEYHVTVFSQHLPETLTLLKDLLLNASFNETEFDKEKEVIQKEIKMHDDEPQDKLYRLLSETAYIRHPYKYPSIGYEEKLRALTSADALKYYSRMYVPNRIVIAIAGGVEETDALAKAEEEFGSFRLPDYNDAWDLTQSEPPQTTLRQREDEAEINLSYLTMAFHSTAILDRDLFAMDVIAMILGRGDNSRLNASLLKKKKLVHSVSCWNYTPRDPGLLIISAILEPYYMNSVEKEISGEIKKICQAAVGDNELRAAKQKVLSDYIFSRETIEEQAQDLASSYILAGDHDFSRRYVEGVQAVTADDIKRAANAYLSGECMTIVRLVPAGSKAVQKKKTATGTRDAITKETLRNGIRILLRENRTSPTVSINVTMFGGLMAENSRTNGISFFTAMMLLKGTAKRDEDEIQGAIEDHGGAIRAFSGFNSFGLNIEILKSDLDKTLNILKDVLANSVFPQGEIDKAKTMTYAMIKEEDDDIFQRGINAVRKALFADSPYAMRNLGTEASVRSLKREDIYKFYMTYCVPAGMVISISGDINSKKVIAGMKALFAKMKGPGIKLPQRIDRRMSRACSEHLEMPREQSLLLVGFRTTGAKDPDRYGFDVLGSILSGSYGRLFNETRDRLSLSYAQGCSQKLALDSGYFVFYVATTKDRIGEARKTLINVIRNIREREVSNEELAQAKRQLRAAYLESVQKNSFFAVTSALDELYGLGYDNIYEYEAEIEKVTKEDVKSITGKYFDLDTCAEVTIVSR